MESVIALPLRCDPHPDPGPFPCDGSDPLLRADTGQAEHTVWTCDFSEEYVSINADYRS